MSHHADLESASLLWYYQINSHRHTALTSAHYVAPEQPCFNYGNRLNHKGLCDHRINLNPLLYLCNVLLGTNNRQEISKDNIMKHKI